jgi:hypothetical protein
VVYKTVLLSAIHTVAAAFAAISLIAPDSNSYLPLDVVYSKGVRIFFFLISSQLIFLAGHGDLPPSP